MNKSTVGILTSGGDAPGMNAAVRAVFRRVKNHSADHEIVMFREGLNGLAGRLEVNYLGRVERRSIRDIIHRGGTFIGTGRIPELKEPPVDCADPEAWMRRRQEITDVAVVNLRQLGLNAVVVVGGDGSFKAMSYLVGEYTRRFGQGLRLVGIPATIDNDIWGTEASIGFDTALNTTVECLRNLRDTIDSHRRCAILEVMGNSSGWIALSAGIAGGATTIMIPEDPATYDIDQVLGRVRAAVRYEYRYIIVVMAEGVKKASGNPRLGEELAHRIETDPEIREHLGRPLETRLNIIGYLSRGGRPSAFDNMLGCRFGHAAADAALDPDLSGPHMVGLVNNRVELLPFADVVAHSPRRIQEGDELLEVSRSMLVNVDQAF